MAISKEKATGFGTAADLREYLATLEQIGELKRIRAETDWQFEVGAISRLACEKRAPAPLFENVKGYPGHQLAAVLLGPGKPLHSRFAAALGVDKTTPPLELIEIVRQRLKAPIDPVHVSPREAPCKEVILKGDDADVLKLPVPWIHPGDGARYIGTWDIVAMKDPNTGWVNWGMYRCMIKDRKSFTVSCMADQHGGAIAGKYSRANRTVPFALVLGADPLCHLAAVTPMDYGVSEVRAAGGMRGAAVPLVKCETIDLEVPANAEIVIEAEFNLNESVDEGPFGEFTGHACSRGKFPLARVKCITHRHNPISTMANMGKPWDDWAVPSSILMSAVAKNRLEQHGIEVRQVYFHAPATIAVVSVKPRPGIFHNIVAVFRAGQRLLSAGSGVVFVGEDVDASNLEDVWWAISTRMHPESYQVIKPVPAMPLLPFLNPEERRTHESSQFIMNATFPVGWTRDYLEQHTNVVDFEHAWSEEMQNKVRGRWREYGYDD